MDSIGYTAARNSLAKTMACVCKDHAPVAMTRKSDGGVMIAMEDHQALEEPAPLLRSPKNMPR